MKIGKNSSKFPKLSNKSLATVGSNLSKPKRIGLISGAVVLGIVGCITLFMLTKPSEEVALDESNAGSSWGGEGWNETSLTDPMEEEYNENVFEEPEFDENGEPVSFTAPLMSGLWYSLDQNPTPADTSSTKGSTSVNNYSKIMQKMMTQYQEDQARKASEESSSSNPTTGAEPSYTDGMVYNPVDLNSNQNYNTPSNSNGSNTGSEVYPPLESISNKLVAYIEQPTTDNITALNKDGITVIEGSSIRVKLFDQLDKLNGRLIIDTNKTIKESEILDWITQEYHNKLLVSKLDYGYLEETERFFYLETTYNISKLNHTELKNWATKKVKSISATTDKGKIEQVASIIGGLGEYKTKGTLNVHSPYTLYKKGYGVCQAYTSLGKIMLDALGIQNGIATGVMNSEAHTWNVVSIDGVKTHVDFTLYDTQNSDKKYLSISDTDIDSDRIINNVIY